MLTNDHVDNDDFLLLASSSKVRWHAGQHLYNWNKRSSSWHSFSSTVRELCHISATCWYIHFLHILLIKDTTTNWKVKKIFIKYIFWSPTINKCVVGNFHNLTNITSHFGLYCLSLNLLSWNNVFTGKRYYIIKHNIFHNWDNLECLPNSTFNSFGSGSTIMPNVKIKRKHLTFIIQKSNVEKQSTASLKKLNMYSVMDSQDVSL